MGSSVGFANSKSIEFDTQGTPGQGGPEEYTQATIIGGGSQTAVLRTFSMWIKTSSTLGVPLFCGSANWPNMPLFRNCNGFGLHQGKFKWSMNQWIGAWNVCYAESEMVDGSGSVPDMGDGNWHHVAVYNPVDSNANRANIVDTKIWLDGQPLTIANTTVGTLDIYGFFGSLILGAGSLGGWNGQYYADVQMDEFAYWDNLELSDVQVSELYNSGPTDLSLFGVVPNEWYRLGDFAVYNSTISQWDIPSTLGKDYFSTRSFMFDGLSDLVDCGTSPELEINGDMTISLWVYPQFGPSPAFPGLVGKRDAGGVNFEFYFDNGGSPYWGSSRYIKFYDGNVGGVYQSNTSVKFNEWSHVAIIINSGVNNGSTFYINGVADGTGTFTITADDAPLLLGYHLLQTDWYKGKMDNIAIFNSAKTIGDLWDGSGRPTNLSEESGLVAYWLMGEDATWDGVASQWTIPDASTNSNDGISSGMDEISNTNSAPNNFGIRTVNMSADPFSTDVPE